MDRSERFLPTRERAETFAGVEDFLKNKLSEKIVTAVTEKISNILSQKPTEDKIFFSWNLETDELKNFNYYYSKFNPENLSNISLSKIREPLTVEKEKKASVKDLVKKIFSLNALKESQHN